MEIFSVTFPFDATLPFKVTFYREALRTFDVVMTGSMFEGGDLLIAPMRETIHKLAPKARLVRLNAPPVLGAVMLGMEASRFEVTPTIRKTMINTISSFRNLSVRQP